MIDVNELRRGNIVQDEHGIWQYVYQIWPYGCELADSMRGDGDLDHRSEEIFPISVTGEVLVRFGFEKIRRNSFKNQENIIVLIWPDGVCGITIYYNGNEIDTPHNKHLHQLQNLYQSLTGKELEIKDKTH